MTQDDAEPLLVALLHWLRRWWPLLLLLSGLGLGGAGLVIALRPVRYVATTHVRVASIDGDPVIAATTAAFEAAVPGFAQRVEKETGFKGSISTNALHRTDIVEIACQAGDATEAAALAEAASRLLVADINRAVTEMEADAKAFIREHEGPIYVPQLLVRRAVRLEPTTPARPAHFPVSATLALGFAIGLLAAIVWATVRDALRGLRPA